MNYQQIKGWVLKDDFKPAIKELLQITEGQKSLHNLAISISARFHRLEKEIRLGTLGNEHANLERNKLRYALLSALDEMLEEGLLSPGETPDEGEAPPDPQPAFPWKVLFIAASPSHQDSTLTNREHDRIQTEMRQGRFRDNFQFLSPLLNVNINTFIRARGEQPQIIHFSGHGTREGLMISDEHDLPKRLPPEALKRLFEPLKGSCKIVLLNSCYSANLAEKISQFDMYVVGYTDEIENEPAISFAQGLYIGLGEGKDFKSAFNDGMIALITQDEFAAEQVEVWKNGKKLDW